MKDRGSAGWLQIEHTACGSINYWTAATGLELAPCILAKLGVRLIPFYPSITVSHREFCNALF
jgi:hypothetical protein